MDFDDALHYMEGLLRFGWKLGNERFEALCARLGSPQDKYAIVHIAGTKGKGSTTALAAAILREAGCNVGAYFSPYVYDVRERVQVNGELIPHDDFARLVTVIRPHIEALALTELGQTTEFELKTLIGFLYFAECGVDIACIEVGLGGRLDATNLVKPTVTVITNIGLDHTAQLGETHALIAGEKAGIIKCGIPCYTATDHPDALAVIERIAEQQSAPLFRVIHADISKSTQNTSSTEPSFPLSPSPEASGSRGSTDEAQKIRSVENKHCVRWNAEETRPAVGNDMPESWTHTAPVTIVTPTRRYEKMAMRMGGLYQRSNAACAVAAVEYALGAMGRELPEAAVRAALATTTLPGRLTILEKPGMPLIVLDGAHNEMAALALAGPVAALREQHNISRLLVVVGMLNGHAPEGVLAALLPGAAYVYVCQPQWKRAQPAEEVAAVARNYADNVSVVPSVPDAVRAALADATPQDMVLITGSFYTVGEVPPSFWQ